MKKLYLKTFLAVALPLVGFAQPVLTSADLVPQAGEVHQLHSTSYVSPGSAGANVTWDFSALSSQGVSSVSYVAPSGTPYVSNFPGATVATDNGNGSYYYYKGSSSAFSVDGVFAGGALISYSNDQDIYRFPLTYNSSYTDPFEATFVNGGVTFHRHGTISVTGDAYGTLILPGGTIQNVLRVKIVEDYQDDYSVGGTNQSIQYDSEGYAWFRAGISQTLMSVSTFTSGITNVQGASFADASIGFGELSNEKLSLNVFPNPAKDNVTVEVDVDGLENVEVTLYNSMGAQVGNLLNTNLTDGSHRLPVDLSGYAKGIYHLNVKVGDRTASRTVSIM